MSAYGSDLERFTAADDDEADFASDRSDAVAVLDEDDEEDDEDDWDDDDDDLDWDEDDEDDDDLDEEEEDDDDDLDEDDDWLDDEEDDDEETISSSLRWRVRGPDGFVLDRRYEGSPDGLRTRLEAIDSAAVYFGLETLQRLRTVNANMAGWDWIEADGWRVEPIREGE